MTTPTRPAPAGEPQRFTGLDGRRKVHWTQRYKSKETASAFNALFPIGTTVIFNGMRSCTESPAACNRFWEAAVFIKGVEEPVRLEQLEVPGYVQVKKKRGQA